MKDYIKITMIFIKRYFINVNLVEKLNIENELKLRICLLCC